jgi:hypothetical protein
MTMPDQPGSGVADSALSAQILVEIGKLQTQVAVMDERLKAIPDHETRLRDAERERSEISGKLDTMAAERSAARDVWARVVATGAVLVAAAAAAADYVHH